MVQGEPYKNWVTNEFPKVQNHFQNVDVCLEERVEESSRKSSSAFSSTKVAVAHATTADVDLVWEKIDEINRAVRNQDEVMQKMIERCQNMELTLNKHNGYFDTNLPHDLLVLEQKIDYRCSVFMETTTSSSASKVEELKKSVNVKLDSLKSKIGEIQGKLKNQGDSVSYEIGDVEKLMTEKINAIDFTSKIQLELLSTNYVETTEPTYQTMESDISNLIAKSDLDSSKLTNIDLKVKTMSSQLEGLKLNQIKPPPPPPPPPLMTRQSWGLHNVPDIPPIPATQLPKLISSTRPRVPDTINKFQRTSAQDTWTNPHAFPVTQQPGEVAKDALELLMCFDSNGKHIDRKKLWKKNGSEYKQCGSLHKLSEEINKLPYTSLKYILISVGTNDLDEKDHEQVLAELEFMIIDVRARFPGIKFIINELLPRRDERNSEVGKFNFKLGEYGKTQPDITIASQNNITDMSMFYDAKHLLESKVPIYAKNIIIAIRSGLYEG